MWGYQGQMPPACFVLCKPIWCLCGRPARKSQHISENTFVLLTNASGNKSLCILPLPLTSDRDFFLAPALPGHWLWLLNEHCSAVCCRALQGHPSVQPHCALELLTCNLWGCTRWGLASGPASSGGIMIFEVPSNTNHSDYGMAAVS